MTPEEMIETFGIRRQGRDQIALMKNTTRAKAMLPEIAAAKPEILAILEARATTQMAAQEAAQAARTAQRDARRAELEGSAPFTLTYHDGEYLSGYRVSGADATVLAELGLARYIEGWGYHVDPAVVDALGPHFTLAQARAYAKPATDDNAALAEAQARAATLGKKVEVQRWMDACDGSVPECSLDECIEWVFPDGHVGVERFHTH